MTLRRVLLGCLLLAVLATQTLGVMHAVVHGPALDGQRSAAPGADPVDHAAHAHSALEDLFTGHGDDIDCQLYDQLSHGNGPPQVAVVVLPVLVPTFWFQYFQGEAVARWATLFDARGPPSIR